MEKLNKNEPITVFVACDGISTGLFCLKSLQIPVKKYISTEIDPNPIKVSETNHQNDNIIRLGDLNNVTLDDIKDVDLFLASTPCTNLSSINPQKKGIYGEGSNLFFKAVELLNQLNEYRTSIGKDKVPFIFENVGSASKIDVNIMSQALGVIPVRINSSRLSGALRNRLYWCSTEIPQPKDKQIKFQDIIESGWVIKDKANAILTRRPSLTAKGLQRINERSISNLVFTDKKFSQLPKDEMVDEFNRITNNGEDKSKIPFRHLTINEMEALMTLPKGYVDNAPISNTQKVKCLGNGWTAEIITFILKQLFY